MFVWFDHRNLLSDRRKTLRFCLLSTKELTCLPHCATCDSIDIPHLLNYLSASQMRSGQMTQDDSYCLISYRWTPIHETTYTVTLFQISKFESEISRPIHCLLLVTSLLPAHDCSLSLSLGQHAKLSRPAGRCYLSRVSDLARSFASLT